MNLTNLGAALASAFLAFGTLACAQTFTAEETGAKPAAGATAAKGERVERRPGWVSGVTNSSTGVGGSSSGTIGAGGSSGTAGGSAPPSGGTLPRATGSTFY